MQRSIAKPAKRNSSHQRANVRKKNGIDDENCFPIDSNVSVCQLDSHGSPLSMKSTG